MDLFGNLPANGDVRVKDWPLMQSVIPTLAITALYVCAIVFGRMWMKTQKPFELRSFMFIYNLIQVVLCTYITLEATYVWIGNRYSFTCEPVDYSRSKDAMRACEVCWLYFMMKIIDLVDTIIFVLRKKDNQITFLHVYHHLTMVFFGWYGTMYVAGGQSLFIVIINSFIHVIMYAYYGLSACGSRIQKYLWWKRYLTQAQITQFVMVLIHSAVNFLTPFTLFLLNMSDTSVISYRTRRRRAREDDSCCEQYWCEVISCFLVILLIVSSVLLVYFTNEFTKRDRERQRIKNEFKRKHRITDKVLDLIMKDGLILKFLAKSQSTITTTFKELFQDIAGTLFNE
ncbi:unnamed protein product [Adineta ricciae]|uniref:Elongation of very long chain fatty acids protein n=1 Tax=Adineta ricciae TaxID=249248 RepID=A0A813X094_ADIRI|nr:unnamed protein product [Adineta ricciae]